MQLHCSLSSVCILNIVSCVAMLGVSCVAQSPNTPCKFTYSNTFLLFQGSHCRFGMIDAVHWCLVGCDPFRQYCCLYRCHYVTLLFLSALVCDLPTPDVLVVLSS
jgi:hypothetical protein